MLNFNYKFLILVQMKKTVFLRLSDFYIFMSFSVTFYKTKVTIQSNTLQLIQLVVYIIQYFKAIFFKIQIITTVVIT
jgi:hypothetical protein